MPRTVVLRHSLPDGSHHFDWMFDAADRDHGSAEERSLITFRISRLPTQDGPLDAERLLDHRRTYLSYEGPLSGGRGEVQRVLSGSVEIHSNDAERFECDVWFETDTRSGREVMSRWIGHPTAGSLWRLVRQRAAGR